MNRRFRAVAGLMTWGVWAFVITMASLPRLCAAGPDPAFDAGEFAAGLAGREVALPAGRYVFRTRTSGEMDASVMESGTSTGLSRGSFASSSLWCLDYRSFDSFSVVEFSPAPEMPLAELKAAAENGRLPEVSWRKLVRTPDSFVVMDGGDGWVGKFRRWRLSGGSCTAHLDGAARGEKPLPPVAMRGMRPWTLEVGVKGFQDLHLSRRCWVPGLEDCSVIESGTGRLVLGKSSGGGTGGSVVVYEREGPDAPWRLARLLNASYSGENRSWGTLYEQSSSGWIALEGGGAIPTRFVTRSANVTAMGVPLLDSLPMMERRISTAMEACPKKLTTEFDLLAHEPEPRLPTQPVEPVEGMEVFEHTVDGKCDAKLVAAYYLKPGGTREPIGEGAPTR